MTETLLTVLVFGLPGAVGVFSATINPTIWGTEEPTFKTKLGRWCAGGIGALLVYIAAKQVMLWGAA